MKREPTTTTTTADRRGGRSGMTRDEIVAFFERRRELYDDFDTAALAADYADDAVIDSPIAGVHAGRLAAEQARPCAPSSPPSSTGR